MKKLIKFVTLVFAFTSTLILMAGCSQNNSSTKDGKIKITTTTDFYGEVAKAVVGNKGKVTSAINDPNVDPHDYEPTSKIAKKVTNSDVLIANGVGYDGWMDKLAQNAHKATYIKVGEDLLNKREGDNPHLWYNPQTMPHLANDLAKRFGKLQPQNKKYFKVNAKKYIKSLNAVNQQIKGIKKITNNTKNKNAYVSEPVFDYALKAVGFTVADADFEKDTENGVDPSPATIKKLQKNIKEHDISLFVFNKQVDSKVVNNLVKLAKKNDIPILPVTETLPKGKTYKSWMLSQYKQLHKIISKINQE